MSIVQYFANSGLPTATEQVIQVGTTGGTDARFVPLYEFYEYFWTGAILLQSDINLQGEIRKLAFYNQNASATSYTSTQITIKLGHMSTSTFPSSSVPEDFSTISGVSNLTTVFQGSVPRAAGVGWTEITLDTPFNYNNSDNLIMNFQDKRGVYKSPSTQSAEWSYNSRTSGAAEDTGVSSYPTGSGNRTFYVPTTRLTIFG